MDAAITGGWERGPKTNFYPISLDLAPFRELPHFIQVENLLKTLQHALVARNVRWNARFRWLCAPNSLLSKSTTKKLSKPLVCVAVQDQCHLTLTLTLVTKLLSVRCICIPAKYSDLLVPDNSIHHDPESGVAAV
jgi:hypothetical protein